MKELLPFASLLLLIGVNFGGWMYWLGRLSERVKRLEDGSEGSQSTRDKVLQLEVVVANVKEDTAAIKRSIEGIQRTLANIATKGLGFHGAAE